MIPDKRFNNKSKSQPPTSCQEFVDTGQHCRQETSAYRANKRCAFGRSRVACTRGSYTRAKKYALRTGGDSRAYIQFMTGLPTCRPTTGTCREENPLLWGKSHVKVKRKHALIIFARPNVLKCRIFLEHPVAVG